MSFPIISIKPLYDNNSTFLFDIYMKSFIESNKYAYLGHDEEDKYSVYHNQKIFFLLNQYFKIGYIYLLKNVKKKIEVPKNSIIIRISSHAKIKKYFFADKEIFINCFPIKELCRYNIEYKQKAWQLYKISKRLNKEKFILPFISFFYWNNLFVDGKKSIQSVENKIWNSFNKNIEVKVKKIDIEKTSHNFLKISLPQKSNIYKIHIFFNRDLGCTSYPVLLNKNKKPITFHIRLINNNFLEYTKKSRLFNHFEIISSHKLDGTFYFGFVKKEKSHYSKNEKLIKTEKSKVIKIERNSFFIVNEDEILLKVGPYAYFRKKHLLDVSKEYILKDTRLRILKIEKNSFYESIKLVQSIRIIPHKLVREHFQIQNYVRIGIENFIEYNKEEKIGKMRLVFKNKANNYTLVLFLEGKIEFGDKTYFFEKNGKKYAIAEYIKIPKKEKFLFFELLYPALIEYEKKNNKKILKVNLFSDSELFPLPFLGNENEVFERYKKLNVYNKKREIFFLFYIKEKREENILYEYSLPLKKYF